MKKTIKSFFGGKEDFKDREAKGKQEEGKAGRPPRRWPLYAIGVFILVAVIAIVVVVLLPESSSGPATPTPTPTGSAGVTVSIRVPATVSAGEEFVATVEISGVQNFDAVNYDVTYDPAVLEVTNVSQGTINNIEVPVDMWDFNPAGLQGTVRIINNVPGVPGVSGSGYLSEIYFHVIGSSGDTSGLDFDLEEVSMYDNKAVEIQPDWVGSSIIVQ
jgi:hypothetical protein